MDFVNKPGEWYIAYHGTGGIEAFKGILNPYGYGLKAGSRQPFKNSDNCNILNNKEYKKCGKGVYLTPKIKIAENNSSLLEINGEKYYLVFMCRVNPYKIRIPQDEQDYWIVSGGYNDGKVNHKPIDEVRPYRILLKKKEEEKYSCFI